ncbi:MAG: outer membrane lipoprotein carrier protein LolA [Proteobacteria bacterium]|nr:outer membrane lipoprotein carrier protein LolA [Pseudomonadota bacterium]
MRLNLGFLAMRHYHIFLAFIFLLSLGITQAQTEKKPTENPDSKIIFKSVLERYRKLGNWRAKFTQENFSPGLGKGSFNEGMFHYVRNDALEKFRYSLEGPEYSDFISNGKEAWQIFFRQGRNKAAEVKHFRNLKNIDLNRYLIFFRGVSRRSSDIKAIEKNFKISGSLQGSLIILNLEPKTESDIAKIELVFENHVEAPKSATITDQLGSTTTIKITSFEGIKNSDNSVFEAKIPSGSKVEEL